MAVLFRGKCRETGKSIKTEIKRYQNNEKVQLLIQYGNAKRYVTTYEAVAKEFSADVKTYIRSIGSKVNDNLVVSHLVNKLKEVEDTISKAQFDFNIYVYKTNRYHGIVVDQPKGTNVFKCKLGFGQSVKIPDDIVNIVGDDKFSVIDKFINYYSYGLLKIKYCEKEHILRFDYTTCVSLPCNTIIFNITKGIEAFNIQLFRSL